jgi:type III pantothenate kinase
MKLVLNVGNTNTQAAVLVNGELLALPALSTEELSEFLYANERLPACWLNDTPVQSVICAVASVVPSVTSCLKNQPFNALFVVDPFVLKHFCRKGFDVSTVGADRIANVLAVRFFKLFPCIMVDCGTAVTTEIVSKTGDFMGGAIMPGRELGARGLGGGTGLLPEVVLETDSLEVESTGNTTSEAILIGLRASLIGGVSHLVNKARDEFFEGEQIPVYVAGGDASLVLQFSRLSEIFSAPSLLTLTGVAVAFWEDELKSELQEDE